MLMNVTLIKNNSSKIKINFQISCIFDEHEINIRKILFLIIMFKKICLLVMNLVHKKTCFNDVFFFLNIFYFQNLKIYTMEHKIQYNLIKVHLE
jgi:hypothetical protein